MIIPELAGTTPWFVAGAIDHLAELIQPDWEAFEWGCGGSTLWLAQRCQTVVTVEHNIDWLNKTSHELVHYELCAALVFVNQNDGDHEYADYAAFIDKYPNEDFDLIFVDGRNRAECIQHALPKLKRGGVLVLDNSERTQYQAALPDWPRWDYASGNSEGWTTTLWVKP